MVGAAGVVSVVVTPSSSQLSVKERGLVHCGEQLIKIILDRIKITRINRIN